MSLLLKTNGGRNKRPNFVIIVIWSALNIGVCVCVCVCEGDGGELVVA